jgi:hypothetical protein
VHVSVAPRENVLAGQKSTPVRSSFEMEPAAAVEQ